MLTLIFWNRIYFIVSVMFMTCSVLKIYNILLVFVEVNKLYFLP